MDARNRVLIADDEPGIADILCKLLKHHGYEVITAISGVEAIELIRTQPPDVVLLDILLPDISGMEVIERVRGFSQIPIIVFTARPDIIESALRLGANDSLRKPFNPERVLKKIKMVLDGVNKS